MPDEFLPDRQLHHLQICGARRRSRRRRGAPYGHAGLHEQCRHGGGRYYPNNERTSASSSVGCVHAEAALRQAIDGVGRNMPRAVQAWAKRHCHRGRQSALGALVRIVRLESEGVPPYVCGSARLLNAPFAGRDPPVCSAARPHSRLPAPVTTRWRAQPARGSWTACAFFITIHKFADALKGWRGRGEGRSSLRQPLVSESVVHDYRAQTKVQRLGRAEIGRSTESEESLPLDIPSRDTMVVRRLGDTVTDDCWTSEIGCMQRGHSRDNSTPPKEMLRLCATPDSAGFGGQALYCNIDRLGLCSRSESAEGFKSLMPKRLT